MEQARTVVVTRILPAAAKEIWDRLLLLDTLQFIAYPFLSLVPDTESPRAWTQGAEVKLRMRLFGLVPLGTHTLHILRVDRIDFVVESREAGTLFSAWNHRISLIPISASATRYTDEAEMTPRMGWLGGPMRLVGRMYLKHRQRRWRALLPGTAEG